MSIPFIQESHVYTISNDRIEHVCDTSTGSYTWNYIAQVTEHDEYFVLTAKPRSIHYLPKSGFNSSEDMTLLRDIIRHNGIKAYFKPL